MYSLQNYDAFHAFTFQKQGIKEEKIGNLKEKQNSIDKCEVMV